LGVAVFDAHFRGEVWLLSMRVYSQTFSNAFSSADDYVRSRLNASELKAQYSNRLRSPATVG
jgi:hypothetical protein